MSLGNKPKGIEVGIPARDVFAHVVLFTVAIYRISSGASQEMKG